MENSTAGVRYPASLSSPRSVALVGANGMLASMIRHLAPAGWAIHPFDLPAFDITDAPGSAATLERLAPRLIINCAAYTNVDGCESQESLAMAVNGQGPGTLARAAQACGATLVHISTDYVFDGEKREPYREEDPPGPRSAYGRSKLAGEQAVLRSGLERFFILRTSWLYGPWGKNFVETIARLAREREELGIVADQVGTPTYTGDLASAIFNLLALEEGAGAVPYGVYHFSNLGECSWYGFAKQIVAGLRERGEAVKVGEIRALCTEEYPLPAPRPAYSVFSKEKYLRRTGALIPDWRESLGAYLDLRKVMGG